MLAVRSIYLDSATFEKLLQAILSAGRVHRESILVICGKMTQQLDNHHIRCKAQMYESEILVSYAVNVNELLINHFATERIKDLVLGD
jgi:hypothetical protein